MKEDSTLEWIRNMEKKIESIGKTAEKDRSDKMKKSVKEQKQKAHVEEKKVNDKKTCQCKDPKKSQVGSDKKKIVERIKENIKPNKETKIPDKKEKKEVSGRKETVMTDNEKKGNDMTSNECGNDWFSAHHKTLMDRIAECERMVDNINKMFSTGFVQEKHVKDVPENEKARRGNCSPDGYETKRTETNDIWVNGRHVWHNGKRVEPKDSEERKPCCAPRKHGRMCGFFETPSPEGFLAKHKYFYGEGIMLVPFATTVNMLNNLFKAYRVPNALKYSQEQMQRNASVGKVVGMILEALDIIVAKCPDEELCEILGSRRLADVARAHRVCVEGYLSDLLEIRKRRNGDR